MKKIILILIVLILLVNITGCVENIQPVQNKQTDINYKELLDNAKEIKIVEEIISLGKYYYVYADGVKVATISGNILTNFGDVFTMKDLNGNFLIKEKQIKRWGMRYTRAAIIMDENDNTLGYICEEALTKLFSIGYYFHFLNENKEPIGISDEIDFSFFKRNVFKDNEGNIDYEVNAEFSFVDTYTMKVYDTTDIPLYHAILMVCIEDAIYDAKESSKKKK